MNSIFQTKEWEGFKLKTGYQKSYWLDGILVLQKDIAIGRTMLYSPMVSEAQVESLKVKSKKFFEDIKKIAKENKAIFYRLELDVPANNEILKPSNTAGRQVENDSKNTSQPLNFSTPSLFIKAFEEMQPEHTLVLDISKSEEEILSQMKQKGRYNIKVADKHRVEIKKGRNIDNFYKLYIETAKRQKITFREKGYFQKLIDILEPKGYCEVFEAMAPYEITNHTKIQINPKTENPQDSSATPQNDNESTNDLRPTTDQVLATAIVSFYKGRATYLFGSSSRENNKVMAPYKLHFEIIKDAKSRGCTKYDFFGVAPEGAKNHPWTSVTSFKEKFGGNRVNLMGSYDLILRPFEYKVFKIAEKIRR